MAMETGSLTLWLLDTRSLWPGSKISEAAASTLPFIPPQDQVEAKRKYHIQDARMTLASSLLKRLYISRTLGIPWSEVSIARRGDPKHGKPSAVLSDGTFANIDFNVSHQGGLVALIGYSPPRELSATSASSVATPRPDDASKQVRVGIDITLVNERDDWRTIDKEGFNGWVDQFADVFSDAEVKEMTYNVDSVTLLDGRLLPASSLGRHTRCLRRGQMIIIDDLQMGKLSLDSEQILEAKLRRFYAFYAYREAYIKMTGDALLASWLKDLAFRNVRSPAAGAPLRCSTIGAWGERADDAVPYLYGKKVEDAQVDLRAYDERYMIACAVQGEAGVRLKECDFKVLDLQTDILAFATRI